MDTDHQLRKDKGYLRWVSQGRLLKNLAEHEMDILLHKAAKKHFHASGIQKLPSIKELHAEYAQLLAEKKADYEQYRKVRTEMRQIFVAKDDVERFLGISEDEEHEKDEPTVSW